MGGDGLFVSSGQKKSQACSTRKFHFVGIALLGDVAGRVDVGETFFAVEPDELRSEVAEDRASAVGR